MENRVISRFLVIFSYLGIASLLRHLKNLQILGGCKRPQKHKFFNWRNSFLNFFILIKCYFKCVCSCFMHFMSSQLFLQAGESRKTKIFWAESGKYLIKHGLLIDPKLDNLITNSLSTYDGCYIARHFYLKRNSFQKRIWNYLLHTSKEFAT